MKQEFINQNVTWVPEEIQVTFLLNESLTGHDFVFKIRIDAIGISRLKPTYWSNLVLVSTSYDIRH